LPKYLKLNPYYLHLFIISKFYVKFKHHLFNKIFVFIFNPVPKFAIEVVKEPKC